LLELGLDHRRRALGPEASALAPWLVALGESRLALGEDAAAAESSSAALRLFERSGALASDYARVRWALARALAKSDPSRARMLAESAREDADGSTRQAEIEAWLSAL
jgi:hypothetical protein